MKESSHWTWGRHAVLEALRAGTARSVLLTAGRRPSPLLDEIGRLARERDVPLREVQPHEIERLAPGQNTQGAAAQVVTRTLPDVQSLLATLPEPETAPFLLVLDQIQDPHNLGALLRTAEGAGVHGVILPERHSAPLSGTVAKVSAGALNHVRIVEVTNLARALDKIRQGGIWVAGLEGTAPQSLFTADLTVPAALVVGGEGSGLRRLTRERCDFLVHLPLLGSIESLNAAVAGSIAMYEAVRQRAQAEQAGGGGDVE
jgi:23S rRNA (guanosine2251-2'-O)-methyltransferase